MTISHKVLLIFMLLVSQILASQSFLIKTDTISSNSNDSRLAELSYNYIYNTTSDTLIIAWVKTKNNLTPGWYTSICDEFICHDSAVNAFTLKLDPFDSTYLVGHFVFNQTLGNGLMQLSVYDTKDSVNSHEDLTYILSVFPYTGIFHQNIRLMVEIYPNPTNGSFTIDLGQANSSTIISLLNLQGQTLFEKTYYGKRIIEIESNQAKGIYLIQLSNVSGTITKKLVIE